MTSKLIVLEDLNKLPLARQGFELVERKGKGHPDSLCDAVAEEVSLALCREYAAAFGRILHYNADKPMLAASHVVLRSGVGLPDVEPAVKAIIEQDLAGIHKFSLRIIRGEFSVW